MNVGPDAPVGHYAHDVVGGYALEESRVEACKYLNAVVDFVMTPAWLTI